MSKKKATALPVEAAPTTETPLAAKITALKALRVEIDRVKQAAILLEKQRGSVNCLFATQKLQHAKAHVGRILGWLGDPSPYPATTTTNAADIPPTDAVWGGSIALSNDPVLDLQTIRAEVDGLLVEVVKMLGVGGIDDLKGILYAILNGSIGDFFEKHGLIENSASRIISHLHETKDCYGFELAEVREAAIKQEKLLQKRLDDIQQMPGKVVRQLAEGRRKTSGGREVIQPVHTLGELVSLTPAQFKSYRGLTPNSLTAVQNLLDIYKLSFKTNPND